ncbi:MAG: hypothetical protein BGO98_24465 [Myxococcales bacterium 68-20]|nr:hypothetical protein [Myxococcales bacterium]OJY15823.1 MAG: hypothetical protein BGO98_24465 [Myxococcales bacterium 68-20]
MFRRISAAVSTAALAFLAAARVAEAAPVIRIEWPTVPGCPAASVVEQRARAAIAQAKEVDDVLAIAEVTPPTVDRGPWQLHIRTRTARGAGERTLEAASCDAVARAAGLLVALAALRTRAPSTDEALDEIHPRPERTEEPEVHLAPFAPLALPSVPPPREPSEAPRVKTNDTFFAPSAGIGFAAGLLPRIGVGANAALGYEASWLRTSIGFRAFLPQETIRSGLGAELSALGASLDVCARLPLPALLRAKPRACAGATVDDIHASGRGGTRTFDARRTAIMAFAGLGAEWEIGRSFRIGADVRVGGSLVRPRFVVNSASAGERELHRPAAVRAETTLTFGLVF